MPRQGYEGGHGSGDHTRRLSGQSRLGGSRAGKVYDTPGSRPIPIRYFFPLESSYNPMFRFLGTREKNKPTPSLTQDTCLVMPRRSKKSSTVSTSTRTQADERGVSS